MGRNRQKTQRWKHRAVPNDQPQRSIMTASLSVSPRLNHDEIIVGRTSSLFAPDIAANRSRIAERLAGRRILIVGGGGSIGSMTTRLLLEYAPRSVHVIDQSENYLADLVRDLRSGPGVSPEIDLRMWPIDYGSAIAERLIRNEAPYDIVLNFAALKHVRSEKDIYSLLQMLDTNIVRQARFKGWVAARAGTSRYFGVSTDKAANPTSLMGATKRLMEDVLFGAAATEAITVTSARFANVAFSNGSLLQAWLQRLQLDQPLAVPRNTRRYFVTQREAGEICLLASLLGGRDEIYIPRLDPAKELRLLETLAINLLTQHGFEAVPFDDELEARRAVADLKPKGRWPLLLTSLDTSGEKPYEEFVGKGERSHEVGLAHLLAVRHANPPVGDALIVELHRLISNADSEASKADIVTAIAAAIPNFHHIETGKHLDQRM
jgi:FlaA1/EpsC-like NDP-sugar epimerase